MPGGSDLKTKDQEYKNLRLQQTTTHQDPSSDFFSKEKNLEKARGLQVPTTEKYIFNFFDPPAFCTKKQEARGLHSKIALAALKGKELGGHQDRKTL